MSQSFNDFIRAYGTEPPLGICADKFSRWGKNSRYAAILLPDHRAGYFGDFTQDIHARWFENVNDLSAAEYARSKEELQSLRQAQEAAQNLLNADASKKAKKFFSDALKASEDHPYLVRKRVKPYGIKQVNGNLLIPVYSIDGQIQSIQFINEAGEKRFMKNGKMKGGHHFIGDLDLSKPVFIAEGYATAVSVYEDTQCLTLVAFNAGNLINVAKDLRDYLPKVEIVIAGDCDEVGMRCAEQASKAVNGRALIPDFGENPECLSDWNDYFNRGVAA